MSNTKYERMYLCIYFVLRHCFFLSINLLLSCKFFNNRMHVWLRNNDRKSWDFLAFKNDVKIYNMF